MYHYWATQARCNFEVSGRGKQNMITTYAWKKKYCVGDDKIDSQHQYLFELADLIADSKNHTEMSNNVMKLHNYCRDHFGYEETVMRQMGYPAMDEHLALHDGLMTKLNSISEGISKRQWSNDDLEKFMKEWLLGHILAEDTKLVKFIAKR